MLSHRSLKICGAVACLMVFAGIVSSMLHWSEARGVYDDICYLRQAHLFQRFGLGGIDTNLARDDDGFFAQRVKQVGLSSEEKPCHTAMPAADKYVLQYPPGTGFLLSLFPAGFQVVPLYVLATTVVLAFALTAIYLAGTVAGIAAASVLGGVAIYFMVNPVKASYSVAPTMAVCAMCGFLTAWFFKSWRPIDDPVPRQQLPVTFSLGLLLGLLINFRIPNLFLAAGYCTFFLVTFITSRRPDALWRGAIFGVALLVGIAPTLWANAVNAGSPLSTTYGPADAAPMDFSFSVLALYVRDMQGPLFLLIAGWAAAVIAGRACGSRPVALIVAVNLLVSGAYFITHTLMTPYYLIPLVMLSMWSLLFDHLMQANPAHNSNMRADRAG